MAVIVEVQQEQNLRISELPNFTTGFNLGPIPGLNPVSNKTEKATVQQHFGAQRASFDWQVGITYSTGDLVMSNYRVWRSLQNSNLGNKPTGGAWWGEEPISVADGIGDTAWAAGVFTYNGSKVIVNNIQYYLQTAAPFKSTNFATELAGGDWSTASGGGGVGYENTTEVIKVLAAINKTYIYKNPDYSAIWDVPIISGNTFLDITVAPKFMDVELNVTGDYDKFLAGGVELSTYTVLAGASKRFLWDGDHINVL